jgi:hypothetical protein
MRFHPPERIPAGIRLSGLVLCLIIIVTAGGCLGTRITPAAPQAPPAILVDYHRTGGIAGLNDRLVIFDNGAAIVSSNRGGDREIHLNKTDLDLITSVFTGAQFSLLEGNYTARHGSADVFHYTISYHSKTVNAEDSAIPPSLQPVIEELNRILKTGAAPAQPGPFGNIPIP